MNGLLLQTTKAQSFQGPFEESCIRIVPAKDSSRSTSSYFCRDSEMYICTAQSLLYNILSGTLSAFYQQFPISHFSSVDRKANPSFSGFCVCLLSSCMPLCKLTAPTAHWYLSFPLLGILQKLKLCRTFQETVNPNPRSIGIELGIPYQLFWAYLCIPKSPEPQSQLGMKFY